MERKRGWFFWIVLSFFGLIFAYTLLSVIIASHERTGAATSLAASIAERKKELGLDYVIVADRTSTMSRPGRNFLAVFLPTDPPPTADQLKALGEIVRDEYKTEPFLMLEFWDVSETVASGLSEGYQLNSYTTWSITQEKGGHPLVMYYKNDASDLNRLVIYPKGFGGDQVVVNY